MPPRIPRRRRLFRVQPMPCLKSRGFKLGEVGVQCLKAPSHDIVRAGAVQGQGRQVHRAEGQEGGHVGQVASKDGQVVPPGEAVWCGPMKPLEQELPYAGLLNGLGQGSICLLYTSPRPRD